MAVAQQETIFNYAAAGSTTFGYGCRVLDDDDLKVSLDGVLKTEGSDYTVTGVGEDNGGDVVFGSPVTGALRIWRSVNLERATDYQTGGDFLATTVNADFDRWVMALQDLANGAVEIGNSLRVPAGEAVDAVPDAVTRAGRLLGFDGSGNPVALVQPDAAGATALDLALRDAGLSTQGSGQVGYTLGLGYAAGTVGRALSDKSTLWVEALEPGHGIVADGIADDTAAIQALVTTYSNINFARPPGGGFYKVSAPINMRTDSQITGFAKIIGTHAGTIFLFPIDNEACFCVGLSFGGAGCSGIRVATTPGTMRGYLTRFNADRCRFRYELDFGIDAQLLSCHISNTRFGHEGSAFNTVNGFCGLKAYAYYQPVNFNKLTNVSFENTGGAGLRVACWLYGATGFEFDHVDFEGCGGRALIIQSGGLHSLSHCWFERNGSLSPNTPFAAPSQILIEDVYDKVKFRRGEISGGGTNATKSLIEWNGYASGGIDIQECTLGPAADEFVVYNNLTGVYTLDPQGRILWRNNRVDGGHPNNKLVTSLNSGAIHEQKGWARISLSGPTLEACSDPTAILTPNSTANVTILLPNPIGSAPTAIAADGAAMDADDVFVRCEPLDFQRIRVTARKAGAPFACTVSVRWSGA